MNPEPSTDAATLRTGRHVSGDIEVGVQEPGACGVSGEDSEILGLDIVNIRLVRNSDGTAGNILDVVGVDSGSGLTGAGKVRAEVSVVATILNRRASVRC